MHVRSDERRMHEPRVFMTLYHHQHVADEVLVGYIPGGFPGITPATYAYALALTQGVVHEPLVATQHPPLGGLDVTGLRRQVLAQELAETAFAYEADAGAVLLVVVG